MHYVHRLRCERYYNSSKFLHKAIQYPDNQHKLAMFTNPSSVHDYKLVAAEAGTLKHALKGR
ncbi:baseplate hub subunit [Salmonella phage 18-India]|nr:baseplate hub subunit [Salmonella phage 18-India]